MLRFETFHLYCRPQVEHTNLVAIHVRPVDLLRIPARVRVTASAGGIEEQVHPHNSTWTVYTAFG